MLKKRAFTLLEMILVIIASGTLLTTIFSVLTTLPKVKVFNDARQTLIQESNDIMNRFGILFQDYTVDYEEYFNRQMVGCNSTDIRKGSTFERNVNPDLGHCDIFTAYGNENRWRNGGDGRIKHGIKYCSSNATNENGYQTKNNCQNGSLTINAPVSYKQYATLFRDVKNDTDGNGKYGRKNYFNEVGDADDEDLGNGPDAIGNADNIKELYLISHDKSRRLLLRKKIEKDRENKIIKSTIQILKLRAFDAGDNHKFEPNNTTVFDGQIDTRACDAGEGFICGGGEISTNLYPNYSLPKDENDGRVDLFPESINVTDFTLAITPTKDPNYAWNEDKQQINPYIKITINTQLNPNIREKKLGNMLKDYTFTLQSSFDTRGFYIQ